MKKKVAGAISISVLVPILLYVSGIMAQFIININIWKAAGSDYRTSPGLPSLELSSVISALFHFPEGPISIGVVVIGVALPKCISEGAGMVADYTGCLRRF